MPMLIFRAWATCGAAPGPLVGILRSDNGDVHEIDSVSLQTISPSSQVAQLLKRREFMLELKRGGRT